MAARTGLTSFLGTIPSGNAGTKATLKIMVSVVRGLTAEDADPGPITRLRQLAIEITRECPERDYECEASRLQHYVRDSIRYIRDVRDKETVQFPEATLALGAGDCDDKALLFSALAESVGFKTRFIAVKVNGEPLYSHVLAQVLIPGRGWTSAEVIPIDDAGTRVELGWFPPNATVFTLAHV